MYLKPREISAWQRWVEQVSKSRSILLPLRMPPVTTQIIYYRQQCFISYHSAGLRKYMNPCGTNCQINIQTY